MRPLYGRGLDYPIVLTFGLAYALIDIIRILFGKEGILFEAPEILQGSSFLGFGYFPLYRLFLIGVCVVVVTLLYLGLERTRFGLVVRRRNDPDIVRILGIDIRTMWMLVSVWGRALPHSPACSPRRCAGDARDGRAGAGRGFRRDRCRRHGSLAGASVAGLLVGVVMSLTSLFSPKFAELSMFALMALTLILRPRGLFGRPGLTG